MQISHLRISSSYAPYIVNKIAIFMLIINSQHVSNIINFSNYSTLFSSSVTSQTNDSISSFQNHRRGSLFTFLKNRWKSLVAFIQRFCCCAKKPIPVPAQTIVQPPMPVSSMEIASPEADDNLNDISSMDLEIVMLEITIVQERIRSLDYDFRTTNAANAENFNYTYELLEEACARHRLLLIQRNILRTELSNTMDREALMEEIRNLELELRRGFRQEGIFEHEMEIDLHENQQSYLNILQTRLARLD